eukprot:3631108-Lingulodinium_polyedra.AAC.1
MRLSRRVQRVSTGEDAGGGGMALGPHSAQAHPMPCRRPRVGLTRSVVAEARATIWVTGQPSAQ